MRAASKSPDAFRTISEVASDLDVPQHVLRFWETKFSQVKPLKRAGGRRYYRPEDLNLLRGIRTLLYTDGFTIKGVQKVLREQGVRYVIETGRMLGQDDRPLPVSHSGSVDAAPEIILEIDPPISEPQVALAETAIDASVDDEPKIDLSAEVLEGEIEENEAQLTTRQRATLESILEELMELKFNLDGARKTLTTGNSPRQEDLLQESEIHNVA